MCTRSVLLFLFSAIFFNSFSQTIELERYKHHSDSLLYSTHLGYSRHISITVPIDFQEGLNQSYPLIIIFDKQNTRSYQYLIRSIDYLTSNEQMPACVIIGVSSEMKHRYFETQYIESDSSAFGHRNELFVLKELIPLAMAYLKTTDFNLLAGHSRYGYFTTAMFLRHPQKIQAVIASSPVFSQKNYDLLPLFDDIQTLNLYSTRYYRFGIGNDYPEDFTRFDNRIKKQKVTNIRNNIKGTLFPEADHNVTPGLTATSALYEIFEYWSRMQNIYLDNSIDNLSMLSSLNDSIINHYGVEIAFSLGILNGKGWYFANEKRYSEAIDAWKILLKHYPNFSEAYLYIMYALAESGLPSVEYHQVFTENLKSSSLYSFEEKEELMDEFRDLIKK
jgi:predicted alpha/beta superfamily hydrolase